MTSSRQTLETRRPRLVPPVSRGLKKVFCGHRFFPPVLSEEPGGRRAQPSRTHFTSGDAEAQCKAGPIWWQSQVSELNSPVAEPHRRAAWAGDRASGAQKGLDFVSHSAVTISEFSMLLNQEPRVCFWHCGQPCSRGLPSHFCAQVPRLGLPTLLSSPPHTPFLWVCSVYQG